MSISSAKEIAAGFRLNGFNLEDNTSIHSGKTTLIM